MKIQYVITDLLTGGVPLHLLRLARAVRDAGHEVAVVSLAAPAEVAEALERVGISVTSCAARGRFDAGALWRLRQHIARFDADVVHALLFHANLACRLVGPLSGLRPSRLICEIQTIELQRTWHLWLDRLTCRLCRWEVGNSPAVLQHLENVARLPHAKLRLIPGGIATEIYDRAKPLARARLGLGEHEHLILWVGRLDPAKGLFDLLEALSLLPPELSCTALLAGEGELRPQLEQRIGTLQLGSRVRLLGVRDDIPALLKSCDLFAFPSLTEGLPNALLEAMAAGRAVVCTDIPAHRHVVEEGHTAAVVPPRQPAELARAMTALLRNAPARSALGRAARQAVAARFSERAMLQRYLELYAQVGTKRT